MCVSLFPERCVSWTEIMFDLIFDLDGLNLDGLLRDRMYMNTSRNKSCISIVVKRADFETKSPDYPGLIYNDDHDSGWGLSFLFFRNLTWLQHQIWLDRVMDHWRRLCSYTYRRGTPLNKVPPYFGQNITFEDSARSKFSYYLFTLNHVQCWTIPIRSDKSRK